MISQTIIYLSGSVVDSAGKGIEGVAVSNGELIERTDAGGAYEIEAQPGIHRFLTVTCPEGFRPADSRFRRIRGDEDGTFHFELTPLGEPSSRFAAAHITDLHLVTGEDWHGQGPGFNLASPDILAGDIAEVEQALSPAFMLFTGDLDQRRLDRRARGIPRGRRGGAHAAAPRLRRPRRQRPAGADAGKAGGGGQRSPRLARRFQRGRDPDGVFREGTRSHPLQLRLRQLAFRPLPQRGARVLRLRPAAQGALARGGPGAAAGWQTDRRGGAHAAADRPAGAAGEVRRPAGPPRPHPHGQGIPPPRNRNCLDTAPVLGGAQHRSPRLPGPAVRRQPL